MLRQAIFILILLLAFGCLSQTKTPAEASVPAPERLPPGESYIPRTIEVASGEPAPIEIEGLTFYIYLCVNHEFEIEEKEYSWLYCHGYLTLSPDEQYFCPFMILKGDGKEKFGLIEDRSADPECRKYMQTIDPNQSSRIQAPPKKRPKPKPRGSGFALDQASGFGETQTPLKPGRRKLTRL